MNEDFVTYELAVKLKEKGYPQEGLVRIDEQGKLYLGDENNDGCAAPTIPNILKWLREEHHLHFEVVGAAYGYNLIISDTPDKGGTDRYYSHMNDDGPNDGGAWDKYEDCVLYGIEYVLDNLI